MSRFAGGTLTYIKQVCNYRTNSHRELKKLRGWLYVPDSCFVMFFFVHLDGECRNLVGCGAIMRCSGNPTEARKMTDPRFRGSVTFGLPFRRFTRIFTLIFSVGRGEDVGGTFTTFRRKRELSSAICSYCTI